MYALVMIKPGYPYWFSFTTTALSNLVRDIHVLITITVNEEHICLFEEDYQTCLHVQVIYGVASHEYNEGCFMNWAFAPPPLPPTHRQKVAIFSRYYFTQISDSLTNSGPWNNNVAHLICRDGYKRSLRSKWPKTLFGYLRYIVMISRNESYGKCVFFHC